MAKLFTVTPVRVHSIAFADRRPVILPILFKSANSDFDTVSSDYDICDHGPRNILPPGNESL